VGQEYKRFYKGDFNKKEELAAFRTFCTSIPDFNGFDIIMFDWATADKMFVGNLGQFVKLLKPSGSLFMQGIVGGMNLMPKQGDHFDNQDTFSDQCSRYFSNIFTQGEKCTLPVCVLDPDKTFDPERKAYQLPKENYQKALDNSYRLKIEIFNQLFSKYCKEKLQCNCSIQQDEDEILSNSIIKDMISPYFFMRQKELLMNKGSSSLLLYTLTPID